MFKYFPQTHADIDEMLRTIGVAAIDELYRDIPETIRFHGDYELPAAMSEVEIRQLFDKLGAMNKRLCCFAGGGCYDHYTPSVVTNLIERSEFLTSYTPYQAEISQGTLHYIFEYQTMMARLTGMDVSNASMYDGATATAEAMLMAVHAVKKRNKILVSNTVDMKTRRVVDTYARYHGVEVISVAERGGVTARDEITRLLSDNTVAAVIVQTPNRYGIIEDFTGMAEEIHATKALFIINAIAADIALLKTPGEWGADIAAGDGQSLGIPMTFGGPSVGYLCCKEKLMRKMPGRIVGQTVDNRGQRTFVLTLQAREQHIRRQKATSNICSNESLMALFVTIYLALMGKEGIREAAEKSYANAHWLLDRLMVTGRFTPAFPGQPFFNEFCALYNGDLDNLIKRCIDRGYLPGIKLSDNMLMTAVTEKRTRTEMEDLIKIMTEQ